MKHYHIFNYNSFILSALVCFALASIAGAQQSLPAFSLHDAGIISVVSKDSVTIDSTIVISIRAQNLGRHVEEATVSLIDSASGDTIENWYPLLPPESSDSTEMFWNTKGTKVGKHSLKAVLAIPTDFFPSDNEMKHSITVNP
jgi:hypothetical protein